MRLPDIASLASKDRAKRLLFAVLGLALAGRVAAAVITEFHPIFPPHAYTDAKLYDDWARELVRAWKTGEDPPTLSVGKELYTIWTAGLYRLLGETPLVPKLFNAIMSVGTVALWYAIANLALPPPAGLLTALLIALWPSQIFFTTQHLKESATIFFVSAAWYPFMRAWSDPPEKPAWRPQASLAAGALLLFTAGMLRSPLVPVIACSLGAAGLFAAYRHRGTRGRAAACVIGCAWLAATLTVFPSASRKLRYGLHTERKTDIHTTFIHRVDDLDDNRVKLAPRGPESLTRYRLTRQTSARRWSKSQKGRQVQTQLFPDAEFHSWLDIALFVPKAVFYVLFMPLPGLYPMAGNLGRMLASMENLGLLCVSLLGVLGAIRWYREPAALSLMIFFCLAVPPWALLEFDLGAAARHKILFLPFLFPFAAWRLTSWLQERRSR